MQSSNLPVEVLLAALGARVPKIHMWDPTVQADSALQ